MLTKRTMALVYYNGTVHWKRWTSLNSQCQVDMTYFLVWWTILSTKVRVLELWWFKSMEPSTFKDWFLLDVRVMKTLDYQFEFKSLPTAYLQQLSDVNYRESENPGRLSFLHLLTHSYHWRPCFNDVCNCYFEAEFPFGWKYDAVVQYSSMRLRGHEI